MKKKFLLLILVVGFGFGFENASPQKPKFYVDALISGIYEKSDESRFGWKWTPCDKVWEDQLAGFSCKFKESDDPFIAAVNFDNFLRDSNAFLIRDQDTNSYYVVSTSFREIFDLKAHISSVYGKRSYELSIFELNRFQDTEKVQELLKMINYDGEVSELIKLRYKLRLALKKNKSNRVGKLESKIWEKSNQILYKYNNDDSSKFLTVEDIIVLNHKFGIRKVF